MPLKGGRNWVCFVYLVNLIRNSMLISIFVHRCSQWTHLNGCPLLSFCVFKLKKILLMCQAHDILTENWIKFETLDGCGKIGYL